MEITALPTDLRISDHHLVEVYDYETAEDLTKLKINLVQHTFSFLLEGTKEVHTNHEPIAIENSSFLLMKSGHCLMTERLPTEETNYRSILLFFKSDVIFDLIRKYDFQKPSKMNLTPIYAFKYDKIINQFVSSLVEINQLNEVLRVKLLRVKIEEILIYLIEKYGLKFLYSLIENNPSQSFINVVENNQLNKLTLKELAFLSNMSVSTFKREFEKHYQESPMKWFQDKRLEYAAFLLKDELKRPSEIYMRVGYESLSNFIQAFKLKFGTTPKQYQTG